MSFDTAIGATNNVFVKREEEYEHNEGANNKSMIVPDGFLSFNVTTAKASCDGHGGSTSSGFVVNAGLATLIHQIEETRQQLAMDNKDYVTAKLSEANIHQNLVELQEQKKEVKTKLQKLKDDIDIATTAQGEAVVVTAAKEKKRTATAQALDGLMEQLYRYKAAAEAEAQPPRRQPTPYEVLSNTNTSSSSSKFGTSGPAAGGGGPPRRVSATTTTNTSGLSRPLEVLSSYNHQNYDSNNRPIKKVKSSPTSSCVNSCMNTMMMAQPKKQKLTRKIVFNLSADADAGNNEAKAKLIQIVQRTPRRELRQIFEIPSQSHVKSLDSYTSLDIMRALVRGQAEQRSDLKARLAQNPEMKRELLSSRGKLTVGHLKESVQERIIFILTVPELH